MKFKKMCFREFIGEMHCTLLEHNFEDSHKITWDQARLEAVREIIEILERNKAPKDNNPEVRDHFVFLNLTLKDLIYEIKKLGAVND